jgi:hypothetical protein
MEFILQQIPYATLQLCAEVHLLLLQLLPKLQNLLLNRHLLLPQHLKLVLKHTTKLVLVQMVQLAHISARNSDKIQLGSLDQHVLGEQDLLVGLAAVQRLSQSQLR